MDMSHSIGGFVLGMSQSEAQKMIDQIASLSVEQQTGWKDVVTAFQRAGLRSRR